MYTFYTDKQEVFKCRLDLKGAKLVESKARLVLESGDYNLMFYGSVDEQGYCKIPINKLNQLLEETSTGTVKLEVIAEDTYFEPWKDKYNVMTDKKLAVEVVTKPKLTVEVAAKPKRTMTERFLSVLNQKDINLANLQENIETVHKLGKLFSKRYKLSESEKSAIISGVINELK